MESFDLGDLVGNLASVTGVSVQLVCAVLCAAIYAAKGKPWVGGAFMGFFLGPFGVFIALISGGWGHKHKLQPAYVPQTVPASPPRPSNTYTLPIQATYRFPGRCPNCNGPVHKKTGQDQSLSCWYCGALIEGAPAG